MNQEKIGKFIAQLRKEKNMTQQELAEELIVDRTSVSKWENGINVPSYEILIEMQKLFNVSINEILYGERKNNNNNNQIDAIPISIINQNKKRIRKIILISTIITMLLVLCFFTYYFINNYNSIKIYKLSGENNKISISNGLIIISREKSYIRVGDIENNSGNEILKIRLYFLKNENEYDIFVGNINDTEALLENEFNYNELFKYNDINYIINSSYLDLILENGETCTIKLKAKKDFSNNNIFNNKNIKSISDNQDVDIKNTIPNYVINKFTLDEINEKYYYKTKHNGYDEIDEYYYNVGQYIVTYTYNNRDNFLSYTIDDQILNRYSIVNGKTIDAYTYNYKNKICENGKCDMNEIDEFKQKHINIIFK